jgi:hypothetical protein
MKIEYTNICICCTAQSKTEALEFTGRKVVITVCYTENTGMSLVRIQENFCLVGSGAVLLPLEVPCTKSTRTEKTFLDNTSKSIVAIGKRGGVTCQAGLKLACDQENWLAINFPTAQ